MVRLVTESESEETLATSALAQLTGDRGHRDPRYSSFYGYDKHIDTLIHLQALAVLQIWL